MKDLGSRKRRRSLTRIVWGWLLFILILLCCIFMAMHFLGQKITVSDSSMNPVLYEGDEVWIDRLRYIYSSPARYDVIVFSYRYQEEGYDIKRIIALPGETVQIKDGIVYVNGVMLGENYGTESIAMPGMASATITLNEDEYFVLGDNRNESADSREPTIGSIRRDEIEGKALFVGWPFQHIRWIR